MAELVKSKGLSLEAYLAELSEIEANSAERIKLSSLTGEELDLLLNAIARSDSTRSTANKRSPQACP